MGPKAVFPLVALFDSFDPELLNSSRQLCWWGIVANSSNLIVSLNIVFAQNQIVFFYLESDFHI